MTDHIDLAGQRYQPSNGTETATFVENWCTHCAREKAVREGDPADGYDDRELCPIFAKAMANGGCKEWVYDAGGHPSCTAYVERGQPIPYRCPETPDLFGDAA
jgi:hypothetical protein